MIALVTRWYVKRLAVAIAGQGARFAAWLCVALSFALASCATAPNLLEKVPQATVQDKLLDTDFRARGPSGVKPFKPRSSVRSAGADGKVGSPRLYPGQGESSARRVSDQNFAGVRSAGEGYELNFENASLSDTVKVILGETLKKSYVFDPRLQGQVTLSTGRPVSETELLALLEVVLQINNAALEHSDGRYRIVPINLATARTKRLVPVTSPGADQRPGYGVSVLPLRHISAKQMLSLIDGFVTQAGSVRADVTRNLLLLRGTGAERKSLLDIAASFDLNWLKGRAAGIFPLRYATAEELVPELKKILESGKGGRGHGTVKFEAISRLNAVLVLAQRNNTLKAVSTWIRRLDKTNHGGYQVYVYHVQHSRAVSLAKLLNATFGKGSGGASAGDVSPGEEKSELSSDSSDGFKKTGTTGGAAAAAGNTGNDGGQSGSKSGTSTTGSDSNAEKGDSVSSQSGGDNEGGIRIVADKSKNILLIRGRRRDYRRVLETLRRLDRPPLQIMINATIAEVTLNDNLRYGVQFFLRNAGKYGVNVADLSGLPLTQAFPGLNFVLGSQANPKVVLDALSSVTKVQVVSSPSVVVLDNQEAKLKVGAEVPVTTQQSTSLDTADTRVVNSVTFRDTGVILKVIPRVSSSGLVTMEVEQESSSVAASSEPNSLTPTINSRRIHSKIAVYSGQTVLLGGLISEEDNRTKNRVPLVRQIPIIGELIGGTDNKRQRQEMIVFIRPQVIRDGHDASLATQELVSRLQTVAPPARWGRQ